MHHLHRQKVEENMPRGAERPDFEPRALDYIEFLCWTTSNLSNGGGAFSSFSVFAGDLTAEDVTEAWRILCFRHPMLGATVRGSLTQLQFVPLDDFPTLQIMTTSSASVVEELLASVGDRAFPLGAPLYQPFALLNQSSGRHVFLTVVNHAAGDGNAVIRLHKEFAEILGAIRTADATRTTINNALPPSWCATICPKPSPWRFFWSGALELSRQFYCDLVPLEHNAAPGQRRTKHLIAIADIESTRSIVERASQHHGMSAFLSACLLQAQFGHMADLGLIREKAKLVLSIPVNLRRFAQPNNSISMGTFPYFIDVPVERGTPSDVVSLRVREEIDRLAGPEARRHIVNWYSPRLTFHGLQRVINSKYHFGPYTTHLGRLDIVKYPQLRHLPNFGYLQMGHCVDFLQADTRIINDRFVMMMNYCEPIVSGATALKMFNGFLRQIGAENADVIDDYDEYVDIVLPS